GFVSPSPSTHICTGAHYSWGTRPNQPQGRVTSPEGVSPRIGSPRAGQSGGSRPPASRPLGNGRVANGYSGAFHARAVGFKSANRGFEDSGPATRPAAVICICCVL